MELLLILLLILLIAGSVTVSSFLWILVIALIVLWLLDRRRV